MYNKYKRLILISLVGAVVIILVGFFAGIVFKQVNEEGGFPFSSSPVPTKAEKVYSGAVTVTNKGFVPASITVKKGTIITFTNKDKKDHGVAADPHPSHNSVSGFDSQTSLEKGQSYSFYFDKKGTFTYHDESNPLKFKGTIIVE